MQIEVQQDRERISALMDGCLTGADLDSTLAALESEDGRERWATYHVISDVLRSPELAAWGGRPQFMERLRTGMARAAVSGDHALDWPAAAVGDVARTAANDGVFRWKMVAGIASFAAVAAVGWGLWGQLDTQGAGAAQLVQTKPAAAGRTQMLAVATPPAAAPTEGDADSEVPSMLRDPRLDELLAAHRQAAGASALGDAAVFLRNATFEGHGR